MGASTSSGTSPSAGAIIGGPPHSATPDGLHEYFDGTNWTEQTGLSTQRQGGGVSGTQTSNIYAGGDDPAPGYVAKSEAWDGTSWTETSDLSTARTNINAGQGTASLTAGIVFGGYIGGSPDSTNVTEEWTNGPATFVRTQEGRLYFNSTTNAFKITEKNIPGATWSGGGNLNNPRSTAGGGGTQTAGLIVGGLEGGSYTRKAFTEQYNGSAWTEVNDLNTARSWSGYAGTYTSAIIGGGSPPSPGGTTSTEIWDGSSWTETTDINTARMPGGAVSEDSTASLIFAGFVTPSRNDETELWNGSTWTEVNDMGSNKDQLASLGTTTAALSAGGTPVKSDVELWDGTSWTETTELNTAKTGAEGAGIQTSGIVYGGSTPPYVATTEFWNGTSWTELNDMSTARYLVAPAGTSAAALATGGDPGPSTIGTNATEEWTASLSNFTITSS